MIPKLPTPKVFDIDPDPAIDKREHFPVGARVKDAFSKEAGTITDLYQDAEYDICDTYFVTFDGKDDKEYPYAATELRSAEMDHPNMVWNKMTPLRYTV